MNKKLLLLAAVSVLSLNAFAKEIVAPPVVVEEPVVIATPEPTPVVETPKWVLSPRIGMDPWSEYTNQDSDGIGYEGGLELLREVYPDTYLGIGAMYQVHADGKDGGEYDSVPVYATAKYRFWQENDFGLYAKGNLGYSFNFNEEDFDKNGFKSSSKVHDGMYWAAGLGAEYRDFFLDVMYQQNMATSRADGQSRDDNNYNRVTVGAGYNFNF